MQSGLQQDDAVSCLPLSGSCRDQMVIGEAQAVESHEPASLREWWVGRSFEPVQGERETAGYLPGQTLDSYEWLLGGGVLAT